MLKNDKQEAKDRSMWPKTIIFVHTNKDAYIINTEIPTIFDLFGIRAFIIPGDHEPIHVHIEAEGGFAKIQVYPEVKILKQEGIKPAKVRKILNLVSNFSEEIIEIWNTHNSYNR